MAESTKDIHVDSWCVTKVKAIETKYQWTIEDFNLCMKKPIDFLQSGSFSSVLGDGKTIEWQLKLNLKPDIKDYLSMTLCRLDGLKDVKPIVKATLMIINSDQQVEDSVDTIDEIANDRVLDIPNFIKASSQILKDNQNLSIICCLKIGLNSVRVFSSEEDSIDPNVTDDYASEIISDFQKLYGNKDLCDCILTAQSNKFYVQRAILAARSSTFFETFKNNANANVNVVQEMEVHEVPLSPDVLAEVLNFIYTGKLHNVEKSTDDLLRAANTYALSGMKKLCAIYLGKNLSIDNVIEMLLLSVNCDSSHLKQQALEFITIHAKAIVSSPKFKTIGNLPGDVREEIMRVLLQKVE